MMQQGGQLRAVTRRKMSIVGPYHISPNGDCLVFRDFDVISDEGKSKKRIEAGESVVFVTKATVKMIDNVAFIHVNPDLYVSGVVNVPTMLTSDDGVRAIAVRFTAAKRTDVVDIKYLLDLRISE